MVLTPKKRRLLIVADAFPPGFAPRMGYLAKYLSLAGWEVDVLVSEGDSGKRCEHLVGYARIHTVPLKKHGKTGDFLMRIRRRYCNVAIPFSDDREMVRAGCRIVQEKDISLVLASSYTFYPLPIAAEIAGKCGLPFVVDLRDIEEEWPKKGWRWMLRRGVDRRLQIRRRNRILNKAAAVVTVSDFLAEFLSPHNRNCRIIFNGYDPEMFCERAPEPSETFRIVYVGTIGSLNLRNPEYLFQAVRSLADEHRIENGKFQIEFYSEDAATAILSPLITKYKIASFVKIKSYIAACEIPDLLAGAQCLLLLARKKRADNTLRGIMTTKFFEYLAMGRPILLTESDNDCMEKTIADLQAGYAASSTAEVADFLKRLLEEWRCSGKTTSCSNRNAIARFSRKNEADEYAGLLEEILQK